MLQACGFQKITSITEEAILAYLAGQHNRDDDSKRHSLGIVTSNHHIKAMKGFTRWLVSDPRVPILSSA